MRYFLLTPEQALAHWNISEPISSCEDQGLINQTWLIGKPYNYVLQWVNPIFHSSIHDDIEAIIRHIKSKGGLLPSLIPLPDGRNCLPEEQGTWRMLEFIPGRTIHAIHNQEIAKAAGSLVGQFHNLLLDFEHKWIAPRRDIHNTPERMNDLRQALEQADQHPLEIPARKLGTEILDAWERWDGSLEQPHRVCHGDLKISNLRFDTHTNKGLTFLYF